MSTGKTAHLLALLRQPGIHRRLMSVLLAFGLMGFPREAFGGDGPSDDAPDEVRDELHTAESLTQLWDQAHAALKHGDYASADKLLDRILQISPDDPWALTYKDLCATRLKASADMPRLTVDQARELNEKARKEEKARARRAESLKRREKTYQKEEQTWSESLQAQRAAKSAKQNRPRASKPSPKPSASAQPAVSTEPPEPAPASEPEPQAAPAAAVEPRAKELPATISNGKPEEPSPASQSTQELNTPFLGHEDSVASNPQPPAGGIQITAKEMSVSPDRSQAVAEGDVEVQFENVTMWCDRMTLLTDTGDVYAEGQVRLQQGNQFFRSQMIHYNIKTKKGRFLQGTVSTPPWFEHGRWVEHLAEGVFLVNPGYITSCNFDPPHYKLYGRRAIVFQDDRSANVRNVAFFVDRAPLMYFPWMTLAERQSPFYIIPGKKKPWGLYTLMGYRFEPPSVPYISHQATAKLDWRENFIWGMGLDYKIEHPQDGKGLLKLYYNDEPNIREPKSALPKGATHNRYRVLWRHRWTPLEDTNVVTDIEKFSDQNFRKEFLFQEEYLADQSPESFISVVQNTPNYSLSGLMRKRINRFDDTTEALPQITLDVRQQRIGDTRAFSKTQMEVANLQNKRKRSELDEGVTRMDWQQQFSYALGFLHPIQITPKAGVRQTYYNRDKTGDERNFLSGQFFTGADASLKLFRLFPVKSNFAGLNLNLLRHVLTPTVTYNYVHESTVRNPLLDFAASGGPANTVTFGLENKLQTRRMNSSGKLSSFDLVRFLTELPYSFHGRGNQSGGRFNNWGLKLETFPWSWLRLESNMTVLSHYDRRLADSRVPTWNFDLVLVGGKGEPDAHTAPDIVAPEPLAFQAGPKADTTFIPLGQWYLGLGHRYSSNDKTEDVLEYDLRLGPKWQVTTFHRFTWKEVSGGEKRFNNLREFQYGLKRDLHDWVAELVYRVDREYGEEIFLTFTLKAYPNMPVELSTSYHEPKIGSQSSPFSPIKQQSQPQSSQP